MVSLKSGDAHSPADIALPVLVASRGDHGAIGLKPCRVPSSCVDHGDVFEKVSDDGIVAVHGDGGCNRMSLLYRY